MPHHYCETCSQVIPDAEWQAHWRAHADARSIRQGSTSSWRTTRKQIIARDKGRCSVCLATTELEVHHVDGDWRNDDPSNLTTLCHDHHVKAKALKAHHPEATSPPG
jgi:5-methylcytosine-specific restriction endonuclease McrA